LENKSTRPLSAVSDNTAAEPGELVVPAHPIEDQLGDQHRPLNPLAPSFVPFAQAAQPSSSPSAIPSTVPPEIARYIQDEIRQQLAAVQAEDERHAVLPHEDAAQRREQPLVNASDADSGSGGRERTRSPRRRGRGSGGGGQKANTDIRTPFHKRFWSLLDCPAGAYPPYEAEVNGEPTHNGSDANQPGVVRIDWHRPVGEYEGLIQRIWGDIHAEPRVRNFFITNLEQNTDRALRICREIFEKSLIRGREEMRRKEVRVQVNKQKQRHRRAKTKTKQWRKTYLTKVPLSRRYPNAGSTLDDVSVSSLETVDEGEGVDDARPVQAHANRVKRKVAKLWRSALYQDAMDEADRAHKSTNKYKNMKSRSQKKLKARITRLPATADGLLPLSGALQQWQVSSTFATAFPDLCTDVQLNRVNEHADVRIRELGEEDWGPPHPRIRSHDAVFDSETDETEWEPADEDVGAAQGLNPQGAVGHDGDGDEEQDNGEEKAAADASTAVPAG